MAVAEHNSSPPRGSQTTSFGPDSQDGGRTTEGGRRRTDDGGQMTRNVEHGITKEIVRSLPTAVCHPSSVVPRKGEAAMPLQFCHPEAPHKKLRIPEWYVSSLMLDRALHAIVRRGATTRAHTHTP